ncbi:MAG: DUF6460 domain-containing protein [Gemmatimonas sp.]
MPRELLRTVFNLLLASLAVGLIMRWFHLTPRSLLAHFGESVEQAFDALVRFAGWAIDYVLVGAIVVVPIWLVALLLKRLQGRKGG